MEAESPDPKQCYQCDGWFPEDEMNGCPMGPVCENCKWW